MSLKTIKVSKCPASNTPMCTEDVMPEMAPHSIALC